MRDEWAFNFRLLTCWLNWEFKIEPCWSELCCAEDWWEVTGHSPVPPWPAGSSTCSEFSLLLHPTTAATGWKPQADFQPAQNTRYPPPLQWSPTPHCLKPVVIVHIGRCVIEWMRGEYVRVQEGSTRLRNVAPAWARQSRGHNAQMCNYWIALLLYTEARCSRKGSPLVCTVWGG